MAKILQKYWMLTIFSSRLYTYALFLALNRSLRMQQSSVTRNTSQLPRWFLDKVALHSRSLWNLYLWIFNSLWIVNILSWNWPVKQTALTQLHWRSFVPAWSKMSEAVLSQKSRHATKDYKLNAEAEVNSSRVCFISVTIFILSIDWV